MPEHEPTPDPQELTSTELIQLCVPADHKLMGQMTVISNEDIPLAGYDPDGNDGQGVRIERDSGESLMLHLGLVDGAQQLRRNLTLAASYIGLHEELRICPYVVGVTFRQLAQVAKRFGFRTMEISGEMSQDYRTRLEEMYRETEIADREPLEVAMVYMRTDEFIERYASSLAGRDPRALASTLLRETLDDPDYWFENGDPVLPAILRVIGTLPPEDPGTNRL
jgi:hypothetical protein